jgi:hypothetical protein
MIRFSFAKPVDAVTAVDVETGEITVVKPASFVSVAPANQAHYNELVTLCGSFNAFATERAELTNTETLAKFAKRGFAPHGDVKTDKKNRLYRTFISVITDY